MTGIVKRHGPSSPHRKSYGEFIDVGRGRDSPLKRMIGGYALGDRKFADWLWKEFIEGKDEREIIGARRLKPRIDVSQVIKAVGQVMGVNHRNPRITLTKSA